MSNLYDIEASRLRVARAENAIAAQRLYVDTLPPSPQRERAEADLETLQEMRAIAERTHLLIMRVLVRETLEAERAALENRTV